MEGRGSTVLGLGQVVPPFGDCQRQKPEEWRGRNRKEEEEEMVASSSELLGRGGRFTEEEKEEEEALLELRRRRGRSLSLPSSPNFRGDGAQEEEEEAAAASSVEEGCCTKCKKRVQFADSLGLCLASVKHFSAAEEPQVPPAVLSRLQSFPMRRKDLEEFSAVLAGLSGCPGFPPWTTATTTIMAPSQTPLRLDPRPEKEAKVEGRVSLEEVSGTAVSGAPSEVQGLVRVQGCRGPKEVTVRYTFNEWLSFLDAAASPTTPLSSPSSEEDPSSSSSSSELYSFSLCLPPGLDEGTAVHFAICYRSPQGEFWDNNGGANYTLRGEGRRSLLDSEEPPQG